MSISISGRRTTSVARLAVLSMAVVAVASSFAAADTRVWDGSTSGNWADPTNWAGDILPVNGDDLVFQSAGVTNRTMIHDLAAFTTANAVSMTSGLYALSGNALTITTSVSGTAGGSGVGLAFNQVVNITSPSFFVSNTGGPRIDFNAEIAGAGGFTKTGGTSVRFSGTPKTYAGGTFVNAGTLDVSGTDNQLPFGAGKGDVTVATGATLFSNNVSYQMNGLNGGGSLTRSGTNTRTVTIGNNNANGSFSGSITTTGGSSGVVKTGTGTQSLGNLTLVGGLTANAGELAVNGTHTGTTIFAAAGATYGGSGTSTLTGAATVNGTFAPGGSAGTGTYDLGATAVTFGANSAFAVQIGGATPGDGAGFYDQLNSTNAAGAVTIDATTGLVASLSGSPSLVASDVAYILTRADAGATGPFAGLAEGATVNLGGGSTATITYLANWTGTQGGSSLTGGNDVALTNFNIAAIPEPASLAMIGLAGVGLVVRRRTKR